jgi:hypothetical protein
MNTKRKYRPAAGVKAPEFFHEFSVTRGSKTYQVTKGTLVSVIRKPGLIAGKYEVLYAEVSNDTLLITVEGPDSRIVSERRRKMIRESDIKTVHVSTRRR